MCTCDCDYASIIIVRNGLSLFVDDIDSFYETEKIVSGILKR